ncbi:MAG: CPBP family intramembrane metalloprotease [Bryobacteraceae bacterium]|nr:CPBP family intramembrane metalloprotease [Bryobacteraceae bacterium]
MIGSLLFRAPRERFSAWLRRDSRRLWLAPAALSVLFCAVLANLGVLAPGLVLLILAYAFGATLAAVRGPLDGPPHWTAAAAIVWLWLPVEFSLTRYWTPAPAQGAVNTAMYGTGVTLALTLLLAYRGLGGTKYRLPASGRDLLYPLAGFLLVAPVLAALGLWLRFIDPFHIPEGLAAGGLAALFLRILAFVAFPEEVLFRSLIQNMLMQKLGASNRTLLLAAVVFGAAHLNNGPGPLPNWRYMLLATIAGFAYGKVFQKSSSVLSSALLHAAVNTVRHTFF